MLSLDSEVVARPQGHHLEIQAVQVRGVRLPFHFRVVETAVRVVPAGSIRVEASEGSATETHLPRDQ